MPAAWRRALQRWRQMNRARKRIVDELPAPVSNDEYLLYQTLLGTLPLEADATCVAPEYVQRIEAYMQKAVRESKMRSSWSSVNGLYEDALRQFIRDVLEPRAGNLFLAELTELARLTAHFGLLNALTQTLCKLTAPGVPDTYQGTEIWDFSLVDPDNRRPVDYPHLIALLAAIKAAANTPQTPGAYARSLLESLPDGRAKLYLIWRTLELRRARPELFAYGSYTALTVSGTQAQHLCAFARRRGAEVAITVAPRLYARLLDAAAELPLGAHVWQDTCIELPEDLDAGMLTNVFDEAHVPVRELDGHRALAAAAVLESFPVGLLANPPPREAPA
jgi:(1->4)-alpha-D-glucan 1-alpha-D-glucosylmutase